MDKSGYNARSTTLHRRLRIFAVDVINGKITSIEEARKRAEEAMDHTTLPVLGGAARDKEGNGG